MAIDKADWHWDSAEKTYRKKHNITGELTEEQIEKIWLYASNHIGLFIKWVINNNFQGGDADAEDCQKVRDGLMTGSEYLMYDLDGKLLEEDVNTDILEFVRQYYGNEYFNDYCETCPCDISCDLYDFISGINDYNALKVRIDAAYKKFKEK